MLAYLPSVSHASSRVYELRFAHSLRRPSSDAGDVVEYQVRVESMVDMTRQAARNATEDVRQRLAVWRLPESLGVRPFRRCPARNRCSDYDPVMSCQLSRC